jgi:hypothetical protein
MAIVPVVSDHVNLNILTEVWMTGSGFCTLRIKVINAQAPQHHLSFYRVELRSDVAHV